MVEKRESLLHTCRYGPTPDFDGAIAELSARKTAGLVSNDSIRYFSFLSAKELFLI